MNRGRTKQSAEREGRHLKKTYERKEPENLWKAAGQAALIGLAGAAAMFATEMLLFPGLVRANDAPAVHAANTALTDLASSSASTATAGD
jgi:hypothetical protein